MLKKENKLIQETSPPSLFPQFEKYVTKYQLLANAKGSLAAKLPRILGQGRTRAEGLDLPPAPVERRQELVSLNLPAGSPVPPEVEAEIASVNQQLTKELETFRRPEGIRRFATTVLKTLEVPSGVKDSHFFAGRLVLVHDKSGKNWSWRLTPNYPIISKIPPDIGYVVTAHAVAESILAETTLSVEVFHDRLILAWTMARHFSPNNDVLILDVARMFKVASQSERFWSSPIRRNFTDIPDGAFIANLINWMRNKPMRADSESFEFVPATLNQAHGPKSQAFFMPVNPEGTQVRPVIYLRRAAFRNRTDT